MLIGRFIRISSSRYICRQINILVNFCRIFVSDHGLVVGENIPPDIGEYGGLNLGVMKELGYTVLNKDADGKEIDKVIRENRLFSLFGLNGVTEGN